MFPSYDAGMRVAQGPVAAVRPVKAAGEPAATKLFIGVELELETRVGFEPVELLNAVEGNDLWGWTYDGSLSNGPELKTQPMSWRYFKREFDWTPFETFEKAAAPFDRNGHYNPGIHVHLSKAGFTSPDHIKRFIMFHYLNRALCTRVGGRDSGMGSFDLDTTHRYGSNLEQYATHLANGGVNANRYQCVNAHRHNTLELRYFRCGPTRARFEAIVEWAHAVFMYTASPRRMGLTEPGIMAYMARRPQYAKALGLARGEAEYQPEEAPVKPVRLNSWERATYV